MSQTDQINVKQINLMCLSVCMRVKREIKFYLYCPCSQMTKVPHENQQWTGPCAEFRYQVNEGHARQLVCHWPTFF